MCVRYGLCVVITHWRHVHMTGQKGLGTEKLDSPLCYSERPIWWNGFWEQAVKINWSALSLWICPWKPFLRFDVRVLLQWYWTKRSILSSHFYLNLPMGVAWFIVSHFYMWHYSISNYSYQNITKPQLIFMKSLSIYGSPSPRTVLTTLPMSYDGSLSTRHIWLMFAPARSLKMEVFQDGSAYGFINQKSIPTGNRSSAGVEGWRISGGNLWQRERERDFPFLLNCCFGLI